MTKRHVAAYCLSAVPFGASRLMRTLHQGRWITILCYHRILARPLAFPFDDDLVSASPRQFERQLAYIAKHFNVINFKQLKEFRDRSGRLPDRALIITFDDGYADNYEVAFPILKRFGMTAVMFVTAGFIGTARTFWWDKLAFIVKGTKAERISIERPVPVEIDLGLFADRQAAARHVIKLAKRLPDETKDELIAMLSGRLGVPIDERGPRSAMTWEEVRELAEAGIEIGAHSVNHPLFSNVDESTLEREVSESKEIIERMGRTEVMSFGAPGRGIISAPERERFERALRAIVERSGYSFSTQYRWGLAYEKGFDPLAVPRLGVETHDEDRIFRAKLAFPEVVSY